MYVAAKERLRRVIIKKDRLSPRTAAKNMHNLLRKQQRLDGLAAGEVILIEIERHQVQLRFKLVTIKPLVGEPVAGRSLLVTQ